MQDTLLNPDMDLPLLCRSIDSESNVAVTVDGVVFNRRRDSDTDSIRKMAPRLKQVMAKFMISRCDHARCFNKF
jgi:hypothetical protein